MPIRESLDLQQLYDQAYSKFTKRHYKESEEQLLELTYQSLDQMNYPFYLNESTLLNRIYISTLNYKLLGNNLLKQNIYIYEYANNEQKLTYRVHTAIFNFYFKIGDIIAELEELYEDLYDTQYFQLTSTTANYLIHVYLDMHEYEKAIQLVQKTNKVIKKTNFDNLIGLFSYLYYSFFAYYSQQLYKESDAIVEEMELTPSFRALSQFGPMFSVVKALQIAQSGKISEAKQLFEETYEAMIDKEGIRFALGYWVKVLLHNGLYKEATSYQELKIKILENIYSTEINTLRKYIIEIRSRQSYEYIAFQDSLTGVYNRNYYEWLTKKKTNLQHYTLVLVDLDKFKKINDTGGHTKGDEALQLVARHLKYFVHQYPDARVIRYGGDEFILCLPLEYSTVKDAIRALHKQILSLSVTIDEQPFYLSSSVGIGYTETTYSSITELFELADTALYEAKRTRGIIVDHCIQA